MKKVLIILLTISILTAFKSLQEKPEGKVKETPPKGGEPKDFSLPAKEAYTLDNGLEVVLVQWGEIPKVQITFVIKTGSIHETETQTGISDILGDLIKEGSQQHSANELADDIAGMGGNIDINSGTHIFKVGASVLYEYAPITISLLGEIVTVPLLPDSELTRIKKDYIRNINIDKSSPQPLATEAFYKGIYPNHPYGRIYSTEEKINSFTIDDIRSFYDKNFGAKRTTIYVVGKFDSNAVKEAITKLATWKEGEDANYPVAEPNRDSEVTMIDRKNAPQSTLMMGLPVIDPSNPDYIALDVTNSILGGIFSSRITSNIREDKGYTYSPFSTIHPAYKNAVWYESADVTTEDTGASLKEIAKEINRLRDEPPSKEELEGVQNYEAGVFVLQNGTPDGIIEQLINVDYLDLDESYLTDRVKNIYAVTPEKVQEMMQEYINVDDLRLVIVGDIEKVKPQIEEYSNELELENSNMEIVN